MFKGGLKGGPFHTGCLQVLLHACLYYTMHNSFYLTNRFDFLNRFVIETLIH